MYKYNDYLTGHNEAGFKTGNYKETKETKEKRIKSIKKAYIENKEEIINKISNSLKETFSDPFQKERMSTTQKERWSSESFRERISNSQKKAWEENYQERYDKIFTDEFRKKISDSNMNRDIKRKSELEEKVFNQIKLLFTDAVSDYWINDETENSKCYDVFIPSENMLIELDGIYWHGLDREKNFTKDQIHNMTNDIIKNRIAIKNNRYLTRIRLENETSIEQKEDLKKYTYYEQKEGNVILNNSFKFKSNEDILIDRESIIKSNLKNKEYTEKELLPVLARFLKEYTKEYGWFYPEKEENIEETIEKIKEQKEIEGKDIYTGSNIGNNFLKSRFKSYWNVEGGPVKSWYDENSMKNVLKYRLGINNSKEYKYKMANGDEILCNETFDINPKNVIRGFVVQKMSVSWFKPIIAMQIYKKILKNNPYPVIWDPSMGFGARMLGFIASFKEGVYFGTDPAIETYNDLEKLKEEINEKYSHEIHIQNTGSEKVELPENIGDLVFTSPPYFDTEKYFNEDGQCWKDYPNLNDWKNIYLKKTFENAYKFLKKEGKMIINISEKYKKDIIDIANIASFVVEDEYSLLLSKDHFSKKRGSKENKKEPILIFGKMK